MKLSNRLAKLTCGRTKVLSMLGGLAFAGAALTMAAPAASAQHFAVGVGFGGPRYLAPPPRPEFRVYRPGFFAPGYGYGYAGPSYWERRRAEEWRAHEVWDHRGFEGRPGPYRGW